ncbi:hypothetical protein HRED_08643, partial [Candidatus Haloredivivus sp. G17]
NLGCTCKKLHDAFSIHLSFLRTLPTVWYLSETIYPAGPGIFGAFETSVAFVILPFFCKQAYGFLDMYLIHEAEEQM